MGERRKEKRLRAIVFGGGRTNDWKEGEFDSTNQSQEEIKKECVSHYKLPEGRGGL